MSAQLHLGNNYGFNVAVVGALGTHVQRFGIMVQGYAITDFAQINASFRVYNNFRNLGPKGEYAEFNAAVGLCLGYGQKTQDENLFISSISNQTSYKNSVAYSYNIWLNKIKTTQVTGIIALQFNHFSMISENDALAKRFLDRFRTGAFLLQYQNKDFQYSVNGTMWTGKMGSGVRNDTIFPEPGYINTENGVYPKLSHGILSAQIKYANEFGQYFQANAGIDAEQIRNVLQNKIVHDLPFFPKKWNKAQNLHFPMIDTKGEQYLYRKEQKIRKPKLFLNGYSSPNVFY
ncbi:MAG: hypothetical protein A3K10_00010 [Bacteroidetes bacterium RIFCSPLOWO2_12_FULL_31_6]|nr:MAG: hypothetical protein A3K10_00010 [Bacteroidetes bacterium RIFCSPLOWO2_12_FULL_31_6]